MNAILEAHAQPTFADLDPHLDWAARALARAKEHLSSDYLDGALAFPAFSASMITLLDCARWVEQRRQLRAHVEQRIAGLGARAAAPFAPNGGPR